MGVYFIDAEPQSDLINALVNDNYKNGFQGTAMSVVVDAQPSPLYAYREKMKSSIEGSDAESQYQNAFPLPKPDSFGVCNNYKSAYFRVNDESECAQVVDLEQSCSNTLNALFYSLKVNVYKGQGGNKANAIQIQPVALYFYDDLTGTVVRSADDVFTEALLGSELTQDAATNSCSCSNALREMRYVAKMAVTRDVTGDQYELTEIQASVYLYKNPIEG
mmetsp:Transcript_16392/g.27763  ORF Transcript_16392/g.27763 Transcript_16392/m.27763 type:complete len:219 (+) Transcript_16392:443-1099(+)|eukprot:CAMPEP_0168608370 /NCGR_PEP_ID=MMETSP0449_2-20121227/591_1 /TAXON_ID=1082188 /ORGANISM="Strombidium rassoulzadegani, Strain ras09" /LENGTH=218 /DNA_ID=CAMNT_0008648351 /DNA_START=349 /DNA_END=1005 /DNA_ORIENTATION=-